MARALTVAMAGRAAWRRWAACRSMPVSVFFPTDEHNERASAGVAAAKAVCAGCPVRLACLEYALAAREPAGIWGGATSNERRAMRRPRRLSAADG